MSKYKKRDRRKGNQNQVTRWLVIAGVTVLVLTIGRWLVLSNQPRGNGNARPISHLSTADFHSLAFSPTEPDTVFFGHHHGLMVSKDGGRNWQPTTFANADAMALALPVSDPQLMYAAGHDVFYKSTDGGKTWNPLTPDLPGLDMHGFTVDPEDGNRIFAHIVGYGIFGSQDGGTTWTWLSKTVSQSTFNLTMGENSQILYAAAMKDGLLRSSDGGRTLANIEQAPDQGAIAVTYVKTGNRLLVTTLGSAAGLYSSDDDGKSCVALALTGNIMAIAVSPLDPKHLIAINDRGEVFSSRDNGVSWSGE